MPPKKNEKDEPDEGKFLPTQALILCDWVFGEAFLPLECAVLLPLCGVPILSYFLTFLRGQEVRDAILLTRANGPTLESYIKAWRREHYCGKLKIKVIELAEETVGDALRHIQMERVITEDFFLLTPDTIVENIGNAAAEHAARRARNNDAILTKVLKKYNESNGFRMSPLNHLAVMFQANNEILHMSPSIGKVSPSPKTTKNFFKEGGMLQLELSTYDCHVDICAPEILNVFAEHFDFQNATDDAFVRLLLNAKYDDELSDQSAFVFFLPDTEFLHDIRDPRSLHAASMEICKGRKAKNATLFQPVFEEITNLTILPHQSATTTINPDFKAKIKCSFIGSNCQIHPSATITCSILLDDVVVEADVEIEDSVIGRGVVVKNESTISVGSIIGNNVVVGSDATLPPFSRLMSALPQDESPNDKHPAAAMPAIIIEKTDGSDEEEEATLTEVGKNGNASRFLRRGLTQLMLQSESIGFNNSQWNDVVQEKLQVSQQDDDEEKEVDEDAHLDDYEREIRRMLRSLRADYNDENIEASFIEIKSYRMGCHKSCADTVKAMMPLVVDFIAEAVNGGQKLTTEVQRWGRIINEFKMKGNFSVETICLDEIMQGAKYHECLGPKNFSLILQKLCVDGVLSDESILDWHAKFTDRVSQVHKFVDELKPFIEWLQDVSDESDSSDEEAD